MQHPTGTEKTDRRALSETSGRSRDSFGNDPFEVKNILKYWALSEKQDFHVIPTDTISISIDKDAVLRSGIMLPDSIRHLKGEDLKNAIPDKIYISLKDMRILTKVDS